MRHFDFNQVRECQQACIHDDAKLHWLSKQSNKIIRGMFNGLGPQFREQPKICFLMIEKESALSRIWYVVNAYAQFFGGKCPT